MFLLLSTPASIIQKTQNLNTDGNISSDVFINPNVLLKFNGSGSYIKFKNSSSVYAEGLRIYDDDIRVGDNSGNSKSVVLTKLNNASEYFVFRNSGSSEIAKIDTSGDYSSDGGSTFVDISAIAPNFMKHTKTETNEQSGSNATYTTRVTTTITPSSSDNTILSYHITADLKAGAAIAYDTRVQITDGTNTFNGVAQNNSNTTYSTETWQETVTGMCGQSSYTANIQQQYSGSPGVSYIDEVTLMVFYLQKATED